MSATKQLGISCSPYSPKTSGAQQAEQQPGDDEKVLSAPQSQTKHTFSFKWQRWQEHESEEIRRFSKQWLLERYCGGSLQELHKLLSSSPKVILDAGCGSGYSASLLFGEALREHHYLGIDISESIAQAYERFQKLDIPGEFLQFDLFSAPIPDASVDIVFSEGVLHHTDSTAEAISALSRKLKPGGIFMFYVYAKKAPLREFTDDYIREFIKDMGEQEAWEALMPLTKLGRILGESGVQLSIPEDIPCLGIKQGDISLQRFFYWYICKAFYRDDVSNGVLNATNFDWYRPLNCHRHTPDEVKGFCEAAGLSIRRLQVEDAGITVVAEKV